MPGSIHLSVVEGGETKSRGPISTPHSIKVSVGKNQYQNAGREDFSFPVTTIRDNLVIMLCDTGGNIVMKKEVKTISVAEKGDSDIVLPLEFGGALKLRLSFVLNEKEKEKIREMRSSVLKRKHAELIKGTNDICSPGTLKLITSKDYSELSNQKMPKVSTESNQNKMEEHGALHLMKEKKKISFETISQSRDDRKGANNKRSQPSVANRNPSDNIKKMISAFESNAKQDLRSQISLRRIRVNKTDSQALVESMSYENEDIKERKASQSLIRKSFSAGNLTEAILQNDPNLISASDEEFQVNMENRKMNMLQRSVSRNQWKSHSSNKVFEVENFHGTSSYLDQGISRYINELSYMDRTSYFYEFSGILMPHHLCLTSAPKKVMNFLESFTTYSTSDEKKKLHSGASDEVQLEIGSTSQTDDQHSQRAGISILNGWLIEQGARIFIVIVACGTIILNTR